VQRRFLQLQRDATEPGQRHADEPVCSRLRRHALQCRIAAGSVLTPQLFCPSEARMANGNDVYDKLKSLGITLPPLATPAAAYVPFVRSGNLVFVSGHIARRDGKPWVGQLGRNVDTATGKLAARAIAVDLLGTLHAAVGDLNKVERIVKVMSLVNSTAEFTEQHLVTNGCSELLGEVFGAKGAHARSAFGVAQIPLGACVEIELIAQVA
jgi:enamine deaminase RidA (YjgF/YER057c/UK114 family)